MSVRRVGLLLVLGGLIAAGVGAASAGRGALDELARRLGRTRNAVRVKRFRVGARAP